MFLLSLGGTSWLSAPSDLLRALTQSSKFVWARSVAESVLEPKLLKSELNPKLGEQGAHRGLTWCLRRIQAKQLFMMAAYHPCWMAACSSSALSLWRFYVLVPHKYTRQGYNATVFAYGQTGSGHGCKEASQFLPGTAGYLFCLQVLAKPTPWVRVNGHRRAVLRRALFRRLPTLWVLQKYTAEPVDSQT